MLFNQIKTYTLFATILPNLVGCFLIGSLVVFNQVAFLKKQTLQEGLSALERFTPALGIALLDVQKISDIEKKSSKESAEYHYLLQKMINRILEETNVRSVTLQSTSPEESQDIQEKPYHTLRIHAGPNVSRHTRSIFLLPPSPAHAFFSIVETNDSTLFRYYFDAHHHLNEDIPAVADIFSTFSWYEKFLYWSDTKPFEKEKKTLFKEKNKYFIEIEISHSQRNISLFKIGFFSLLFLLLNFFISLFMTHKLIKKITLPIEKMNAITDEVRKGNFDSRLNMFGFVEFRALFNKMNLMIHSIHSKHREMQIDVEQSTHDLHETLETIESQNIELSLAKKEAQKASKIKSAFLANISHELRTPLNSILGFSQILRKSSLSLRQQDYIDTIYKSSQNLLTMINDILDFSKMEAGKLQLDQMPFVLYDCAEEVITMLSPLASEKNLEVILDIDHHVPSRMIGDPVRLKQILTNLVSNAIKFTPQGFVLIEIKMLAHHKNSIKLEFAITDSGIGISLKEEAHLFEPFVQLEHSTGGREHSASGREYGTGLGLAICKHLTKQMQGEIGIRHLLNHQGACFCFTVTFPIDFTQYPEPILCFLQITQPILWIGGETTQQKVMEKHFSAQGLSLHFLNYQDLSENTPFHNYYAIIWHDFSLSRIKEQHILRNVHIPIIAITTNMYDMSDAEIYREGNKDSHRKPPITFIAKPVGYIKLLQVLSSFNQKTTVTKPLASEPLEATSKQSSILIVDDHPANLKLIRAVLSDTTLELIGASNGFEALQQCRQQKFDLILMDIQMPILNGLEATLEIRRQSLNSITPIVAVTAHAIHQEKSSWIEKGFNDYLTKPLDEKILFQIIEKWMPDSMRPKKITQQITFSWQESLRLANHNETLARELITLFIQEIDSTEHQLRLAWEEERYQALQEMLHKLQGATRYIGTPELRQWVSQAQKALENHALEQMPFFIQSIISEMYLVKEQATLIIKAHLY